MSTRPVPQVAGPGRAESGPSGQNGDEVAELRTELREARTELREARETIEAIRGGGVDSLVIGPAGQEQLYSRSGTDRTYRLVVEAMNEGAATISPRGVILYANPRLGLMTGRSPAELLGTAVLDLISGPQRAEFTRLLDIGASGTARAEMQLAILDGTSVPVLLAVSGFDLDGMLLRCLVLTDLSAQRAAEAQTAAAHQALRVSEERLLTLVDNAPIGIEELTLSGELVRVNPRLCEITGYTGDELRSLRIQDFTHPGDLDADLANLRRLGSGEIDSYSMEKRDVRKDGGVVWVEANRAAVHDPDGNLILVVGAVRDITAQRDAEAEVQRLKSDLEARVERRTADLGLANKNLEAFSYSVSHDLRAPLRALSGYSEALLEDYSDHLDETGRGYAERIQAASERMATLIDDLLQLARVSRSQMHIRPVDLSAEVAGVVREFQSADPGRRIRVSIQDGVRATADRGLIRTVLQNLVENAWKFTTRQEDPAIEFGSMPADDAEIGCFVRDNGAGFDPAHAAKLFEPFERLHTDTQFAGTGIGLASVQRIIERHGGRIWAESEVGIGATFYFTLDARHIS
jgi:PAS domain S-box-containing protein